jgi:hypothetical protein
VCLAVPLRQPLDHHRAGGHVDAERQRLGGEHDLDKTGREQLFDDLLEGRQHAGVVTRDAAREPFGEVVVSQHRQVVVGDVLATLLHVGPDDRSVLGAGEP